VNIGIVGLWWAHACSAGGATPSSGAFNRRASPLHALKGECHAFHVSLVVRPEAFNHLVLAFLPGERVGE
jgi:hypothetical protein